MVILRLRSKVVNSAYYVLTITMKTNKHSTNKNDIKRCILYLLGQSFNYVKYLRAILTVFNSNH